MILENSTIFEQFVLIAQSPIYAGDLISKDSVKTLMALGYITTVCSYYYLITKEGFEILNNLGFIKR